MPCEGRAASIAAKNIQLVVQLPEKRKKNGYMIILEIMALIFLCKKNGNLAIQKGLKPSTWKWYTVIAWIVAEMLGGLVAIMWYRDEKNIQENMVGISALGLISAFGGYLFVKRQLEKKPDFTDEQVNGVGVDDLQPPGKS